MHACECRCICFVPEDCNTCYMFKPRCRVKLILQLERFYHPSNLSYIHVAFSNWLTFPWHELAALTYLLLLGLSWRDWYRPYLESYSSCSLLWNLKGNIVSISNINFDILSCCRLLHIILLAFNTLAVQILSTLVDDKESVFAKRENSRAIILVASQVSMCRHRFSL